MADKEPARAKKAALPPLGDKILQNATAADAAVVIVLQKLSKLCECKFIICTTLKKQIKDALQILDPVYEFLASHPEGSKKGEWNSNLLEAVYRMEDGIDIYRYRIALEESANANQTIGICRPNLFLILWAKYLLWRCLQQFNSRIMHLKKVEHIPEKSQGSTSTKAKAPQRHDRAEQDRSFFLDFDGNMAARQGDMVELKKQMLPGKETNNLAVIVGETGFGKTFLARKMFTQLHDHFDCCAWVNVSRIGESDKVLRSLVKQVSEGAAQQPYMHSRELLLQALYEKSYLIVLDDVVDLSLIWDVILNVPDLICGGRLLITTQTKSIADFFDFIELKKLGDEEIKALFKRNLEIGGKSLSDEVWKEVGETFITKCQGSPLILNLLSGFIVKSSDPIKDLVSRIPYMDNLDDLFAYCYNKMPRELKPCFLYMAIFPKGLPIPVRRLLRLWLSEGLLVVPPGAKMEPEDLGLDYLKELMTRNLIEAVKWKEDGSPTRVRAITCLHDLICSGAIGTELLYINTQNETEGAVQHQQEQAATRLRWLTEHWNIEVLTSSPVARINYLRSFVSFNTREGILTQDIGSFLGTVSGKGFNLLSVLDLEGVYKPNLDKVLGKLVLLKHLGLRSTALDSLPKSVANLPYLETLDLKHTNITELPKSFWKKSRNLRHLYLNSYCYIDRSILSSSFATSTEPLANLYTFSGAVVDTIHVDESAGIIEGLSNIKKLTKLGIIFRSNSNQNAIGDWISSLTNLQSLKLGFTESNKPSVLPSQLLLSQHQSLSKLYLVGKFEGSWKFFLPYNLVTLTLYGSQMSDDHMIQLGHLTNLKVLNLRANSFTKDILRFPSGLLKHLLVLRLWKLNNLKKIELDNDLQDIKTIELRNCPNIEDFNGIERIGPQRLVLLQLIDMKTTFVEKMKELVKDLNKKITVKITKPNIIPTSEEVANSMGY